MKKLITFFAFTFLLSSCGIFNKTSSLKDDGKITITFVQINDVYEIAPMAQGREGGVARVATLKQKEKAKNPNTYMVIAGDFLSPSVYNSLRYKGERVRGKQMVDALNIAGLDLATFGNHEFDIKESELLSRINESDFNWVASNTFHKTADGLKPFEKTKDGVSTPIPPVWFQDFKDADGTEARVGFIGLNIPFNKAEYVGYTDFMFVADSIYHAIKDECDAVVAITHLDVKDDIKLAQSLPGLALIMGGHEHDMQFEKVNNVYITKAHANAKSAYVNYLTINKKKNKTKVIPKLVMIDSKLDLDPATTEVVDKWVKVAHENFSGLGFDAEEIIMKNGKPLEGREIYIRSQSTNLSQIVVASMEMAAPDADLVLINSGSIRIDDILYPPISQYDIIRALPYGGYIMEVEMKGSLLKQVMAASKGNSGNGGYLQHSQKLQFQNGKWQIAGKDIEDEKVYHIALADFLMTGGEANMGFLNKDNPGIIKVYPAPGNQDVRRDIRLAIVEYMKSQQ